MNFHKYVDDSHHWTETYSPLSTNSDFSSILKQNMWYSQQWRGRYTKITYAKHLFKIVANNSNKMILFLEFLCCALNGFLQLLLFFTPRISFSQWGCHFRNTEGLFACTTKLRGRSDGSERKVRSFVRTTIIRKDKVNISSETVYLLFSKNMPRYITISLSL